MLRLKRLNESGPLHFVKLPQIVSLQTADLEGVRQLISPLMVCLEWGEPGNRCTANSQECELIREWPYL